MDFNEIGEVSLQDMRTIPFIKLQFRAQDVKRNDTTMCKETHGDCLQFVNKYLNISWF